MLEAVEDFLLAIEADGLKPKTIIWYRYILENNFAVKHGAKPLGEVDVRLVRAYIRDEVRKRFDSEDTIHGHIRALHRFFKWCTAEYQITNPMHNILYPAQPKPKLPKAVNVFDVVRLLESCGDDRMGIRDKVIIAFLMDTGCRAAGLCGLKYADLELEHYRAIVREKGDKLRMVYFTETTAALLIRWIEVRERTDTLFHNHRAAPMTPNGLLQMLYRRAEDAGVSGRVNPHAFRHGFAREFLRQGGDLATLSRILGHTGIEVTAAFYAVFTDDELAEAHKRFSPLQKIRRVMDTSDFEEN